jgi:hypothetical protein
MAAPRSVRIPRRTSDVATPVDGESAMPRFIANTAGTTRGTRLFGLYLLLLAVIYLLFVGLAVTSRPASPATNSLAWGLFSGLAALFGISGWWVTLGRAPRGVRMLGEEFAVQERLGRIRRFPSTTERHVVRRFPASPLGPEPTEFVELTERDGVKRTYLVGESFFGAPGA